MTRASRPASPWHATPLVAIASFAGVMSLQSMVDPGAWLAQAAAVAAVVTVVVIVTRILSRSRLLPTLVGAIASLELLVVLFARDDAGGRHLLPTPGALRDLFSTLRAAADYAATTVAPAEVTTDLLCLITACLLALFLAADHVAVSWRAAASAGLILMLPWLPAAVFQQRVPILWLMIAVGAWLLTMALTRTGDPRQPPVPVVGAFAVTGATLGVALLVVPSALGGNGWGLIPRFDAPSSLSSTTRLNVDLDLRTSLTTNSTAPALVYSADGPTPDVLRLYSLADFDGVSWSYEPPASDELVPATGAGTLWPVDVGEPATQTATYTIEAVDSAETNLAVPAVPRSIEADGAWSYSADSDEVVATDDGSSLGATYTVEADTGYLSEERLEQAQGAVADGDAGVDRRYLELPAAMDTATVGGLAAEVTAEATSRFTQAVALQDYLRDPSEFVYDTSVDPSTGDTVSTFLEDRTGYCVQFATTMAMMARTLDIPARIAIGFLSGSQADDGRYIVQGGDAHAWPELWFPTVGWVRFEPTPSVQTGPAPGYTRPESDVVVPVPDSATQAPSAAPVPERERPDTPNDPSLTGNAGDDSFPWWWVVAGVIVAAAGTALVLLLRRRHAAVVPLPAPERAWLSVRDALPAEAQWSPTLTPHEATEHVDMALHAQGRELSGVARESLCALANAVADHRYAPTGSEADEATLMTWSASIVAELERDTARR